MTLEQAFNNLKKDIYKAIYSRGTLKFIGQLMVGKIKQRTRTGFGFNRRDGATEKRLKPLSPGYIKERQRLQRIGRLSSETSPSKSNLTKTGKMIDDLTFQTNSDGVTIMLATPESAAKARYSAPRHFLKVSKADRSDIANLIKERIINALKR